MSDALTADPVDTHDPAGMAAFMRERAKANREIAELPREQWPYRPAVLQHWAFRFEQAAELLERLERERSEWAAVAATRNVNLAIIAEERDQLADLLQALCDEQNGPPLERRKGEWQRAYDQARAYLRRAHYSGPQQGTRPAPQKTAGES